MFDKREGESNLNGSRIKVWIDINNNQFCLVGMVRTPLYESILLEKPNNPLNGDR